MKIKTGIFLTTICLFTYSLLSFTIDVKKASYQQTFWPTIQGKWWSTQNESGNIVRMDRIPLHRQYLNFFSKDSCEIMVRRYDHKWIKKNYRWISRNDSLFIYSDTPFLAVKVIKLTNNELHFNIPKE